MKRDHGGGLQRLPKLIPYTRGNLWQAGENAQNRTCSKPDARTSRLD
jgi:hypothetical protein